MRGSATKALVTVLLGAALFVGGCKQGEGERCQITDDCDTAAGFYCELAGNTVAMGGFCRSSSTTGGADMSSSPADMAKSPDLATPPDLNGTD